MSTKCISSVHIEKLGHKIHEIRERALKNLACKLENGYIFDNDLARSKEILQKLFEWFLFPDCSEEDIVLNLIKHILETESGKTLIKFYGPEKVINELKQISNYVEQHYFSTINDLIKSVEAYNQDVGLLVPPLVSDFPLSYRSGEHNLPQSKLSSVQTTATPIIGIIQGSLSNEQEAGVEDDVEQLSTLNFECEKSSDETIVYLPYYTLCWFPLINTDQHVLESVENSLKNPSEASALLHTCEFFSDVMLQDFPAEVFLQRPSILLELQKLVSITTSSKIKVAALNALVKFTKLLRIRINYYSDPCIYNLKQFLPTYSTSTLSSPISTTVPSNETSTRSNSSYEIEKTDTIHLLKAKQLSLPHYCLNTILYILDYFNTRPSKTKEPIYKRKWRLCTIQGLSLLNDLISLLELCFSKKIWLDVRNVIIADVIKVFKEVLIKFGDTIDYIRYIALCIHLSENVEEMELRDLFAMDENFLEAFKRYSEGESATISTDFETNSRFIHINLLNSILKLLSISIPTDKIDIILPRNLKNVITNTLLDPSICRLFPGIHNTILELVKNFSGRYENDTFTKYQDMKTVCKSMSLAIDFLKNYKFMPMDESISLVKGSLKSLDFHKKLSLIKIFIDLCTAKLPTLIGDDNIRRNAADVILELLRHCDIDIKRETYKLCTERVISAVGPKLNTSQTGAPGSQILFLLDSAILNEITLCGLSSSDTKIQKQSEDILIHILKCKILVSDEIWNSVVEALILTFPALLCYVEQKSLVGRTIMNLLDPDTGPMMNLATLEILKGNCCLLFNEDLGIRNEAISRLCWLLASQGDSRDLLPRINNLFDKTLTGCCQVKHAYDVNRIQATEHYYQPSSLEQVLELLNSNNVEPVIRRSALTQISVMVEDYMMHNIFLQKKGVYTILNVMRSGLDDSDYKDYPDSIIPATSVLKSLCLHNATVRQELSTNLDLYYLLLRGLFLFCTEERMKHEGSTLLFLLLYNNFIKGNPAKSNLSLPHVIISKLKVPFTCQSYQSQNKIEENKLTEILLQDKSCLQSLQIHWNSEWFGSFNELLTSNEINYKSTDDFNKLLRLSNSDLVQIQNSSMEYCMSKCLVTVQNAINHQDAIDSLIKLTGYINLYKCMKYDFVFENNILNLPWMQTFNRLLNTVPSSREDDDLLEHLLQFFITFVTLYKEEGTECWVSNLLKCETNALLTLLSKDNIEDIQSKTVNKELLLLITTCVSSEQHYLGFYGLSLNHDSSWSHVIELVASNLKFNDSQHFYNLAYLDSLLSCLVHLTASLGWTKNKNDITTRISLIQLVTGLCEMIGAFHCGKGSSAANSVMGLSITRHAVLILNHLLVEMQQANIIEWESCFVDEESGIEDNFYNLTSLWSSRDVVLRAGIFQLFAGLAMSHKCAINIVQEYKHVRKCDIWEVVLNILLDHEEASIVRENVADFLTNLTSHTINTGNDGFALDKGIMMTSKKVACMSGLLKLFGDLNFCNNLQLLINCLYVKTEFYIDEDTISKSIQDCNSQINDNDIYAFTKGRGYTKQSVSSNSPNNETPIIVITTPGLVKSLSVFLYNLMNLAPTELAGELQQHGLIRALFKSLFIAKIDIVDTKDLALYCDVLEMNRAISALLNRAADCSETCFNSILNMRDCLNILLSLLNTKMYNCNFSQLIYLRNKLWGEIFNLLATLLNYGGNKNENFKIKSGEVLQIIASALAESSNECFLQALCESLNSYNSSDLQNSALTSLTSLLKIEISTQEIVPCNTSAGSIQNLLDNTHTPRTNLSKQEDKNDLENVSPNSNISKTTTTKDSSTNQTNLHQAYLHSLNRRVQNTETWEELGNLSEKPDFTMAGAELCRILLHMLEIVNIKGTTHNTVKKKSLVLGSLTNLLCVSLEAKKCALSNGLMDTIMQQIRKFSVKLSLESVESLRRISDKKRLVPVLQEIEVLVGLLTNFLTGDSDAKNTATDLGLADLVHKLWAWIMTQKSLLVSTLRMLCTYTIDCLIACQSLTLTSPVAGTGPRKLPSNISLLHAVITLISKEMEQISRTRDLLVLELSFQLLANSCDSTECRIILSKSNLLQSLNRLHPAITKKQKPWEAVELIWLRFLEAFSMHPEGQSCIAKIQDVLDLIIILSCSNRSANKQSAMAILRNISFNSSNRPRLLTSGDFLNVLNNKLVSGSLDEKIMVVTIIWALAANNQKAKLMLKCAGLETKLQEALKALHLSVEYNVDPEVIDQMYYVLKILKDDK